MQYNPDIGVDVETFIEQHQGLVHHVCKRFFPPDHPLYEEIVQIGMISLMKVYQNYSKSHNTMISTYAVPFISGHIKAYLRDHGEYGVRIPRSTRNVLHCILEYDLYDKSPEEILEKVKEHYATKKSPYNYTLDHVMEALAFHSKTAVVSLSTTIHEGDRDDLFLEDALGIDEEFEELADWKLFLDKYVNERERKLLLLAQKGLTQMEIGERLGISQVQVSRILHRLYKRYRAFLEGEPIPPKESRRQRKTIKRSDSMPRKPAKGDREKAIQLLKEGVLTDKEISNITGVPLGSFGALKAKIRQEQEAASSSLEAAASSDVVNASHPIGEPALEKPILEETKVMKRSIAIRSSATNATPKEALEETQMVSFLLQTLPPEEKVSFYFTVETNLEKEDG